MGWNDVQIGIEQNGGSPDFDKDEQGCAIDGSLLGNPRNVAQAEKWRKSAEESNGDGRLLP